MTRKKHQKAKSYISVMSILLLQMMSSLNLFLYAAEVDTIITDSSQVIESIDVQKVLDSEEVVLDSATSTTTEVNITELIPTMETVAITSDKVGLATTSLLENDGTRGSEQISTSTGTDSPVDESISNLDENMILFDIQNQSTSTEENNGTISIGDLKLGTTTEENIENESIGDLPLGTTTISTGQTVAAANILNIVNTNLINSTGSVVLENLLNGGNDDVDLRPESLRGTTSCTLLNCNGVDSITAHITADAALDNTISLLAVSGSNVIDTSSGAIIDTGNAYAGLNLINIANTTIIDSQYLLLSLNSFGNLNGDIIFPSLGTFFSSSNSSSTHLRNIDTESHASITNDVNLGANTGNNVSEGATGFTQTGTTNSSLNIYSNSNQTILNGNSFMLLLRVTGTWFGNFLGTTNTLGILDENNTLTLNLEENRLHSNTDVVETNLQSRSSAQVANNVTILADTGNNRASNIENSEISTGDAYAAANIINIANTNIIGRNWILAIINIFGDFNGDITFGRPDLWVGEQVSGGSVITNDSELTYKVTIINKGDSMASNVRVISTYDTSHLLIIDSSLPYTDTEANKLTFIVGNMAAYESKEIIFHAKVKDTSPGIPIRNIVVVSEDERDNNYDDNTDTTTIITTGATPPLQTSNGGGYQYLITEISTLTFPVGKKSPTDTSGEDMLRLVTVTRLSTSTVLIAEGSEANQTIIIRNPTGTQIPSVLFSDFLLNSRGEKIKTEFFDLGTLLPYEEITVTYTTSFGAGAEGGIYTLSSETLITSGQTTFFSNNGTIAYIPVLKNTVASTPVNAPVANPVSNTVNIRPEIKRSIVVDPFIGTTYAGTDGPSPLSGTSSSIGYTLLFIIISSLRVLTRNIPRLYDL